jgi:hypothetical protein
LFFFYRDQQYEYVSSEYDYEEEDEQEEEEIQESYCYEDSFEKDHLVADIICGGESLVFLHNNINKSQRNHYSSSFQEEEEEEFITPQDSLIEENAEEESTESLYVHQESPIVSDFETETNETEYQTEEEDADSVHDSVPDSVPVENRTTSPITLNQYKSDDLVEDIDKNYDGSINFTSYLYSLLHYSHASLINL